MVKLELTFSRVLLVVLIFQGLSMSIFLLLTGRGKSSANIILGLFLIVLSCHMVLNLLQIQFVFDIIKLNNTLGFLYGPLIWIYVQNIINANTYKPKWLGLLFVPFLLASGSLFTGILSDFGPLIVIQTIVYFMLSFKAIKYHERVIRQTKSHSNWISLVWLNQFLGGVFIMFIFDLARILISMKYPDIANEILFYLFIFIIIIMLNILVYRSINHTSKFLGISEEDKALSLDKNSKTNALDLTSDEIEIQAKSLEECLKKGLLFKQAELSLTDFSEYAKKQPRMVSQVINAYFNTNFSDWINEYRLDYAKNQLKKTTNKEKNISQILYESGFNSTSSFYKIFSDKVGQSPKEYRDAAKASYKLGIK